MLDNTAWYICNEGAIVEDTGPEEARQVCVIVSYPLAQFFGHVSTEVTVEFFSCLALRHGSATLGWC